MNDQKKDKKWFMNPATELKNGLFGKVSEKDEFLHPVPSNAGYTEMETSYFGFNIPEESINCEIYIWFHTQLKIMSAGVFIWKGIKSSTLECDYVNYQQYLPFPEKDIGDYVIPVGLKIKIISPLRKIQINYEDNEANTGFDLTCDALIPPVLRADGKHFVQPMKTTGKLSLRGETHTIDGYFHRDRSYSNIRPETRHAMPPFTWMVGVFDENFAFHVSAFDDRKLGPEWADFFDFPGIDNNLKWGYIYRDGEIFNVTRAAKITTRGNDGLSLESIQMDIDDSSGRNSKISGYVNAMMPWQPWTNVNVYFAQMRWECDAKIGWGDAQDIQYNDFIHKFKR